MTSLRENDFMDQVNETTTPTQFIIICFNGGIFTFHMLFVHPKMNNFRNTYFIDIYLDINSLRNSFINDLLYYVHLIRNSLLATHSKLNFRLIGQIQKNGRRFIVI